MVDKQKILAGRKAVDAYRTAHTQLHSKPWHRGIPEEHIPLVNKLLAELKEHGFDSVGEFQQAEREFLPEILADEFETQAVQRQVKLLDLSQFSFAHNMAVLEAISTLRQQGISPDTLVFPHSDIEKGVCIMIAINADIDSILNVAEAETLGVPFIRMMIPSRVAVFLSSNNPMPTLLTKGIYDVDVGWELWLRIMEKTWNLLNISTERSGTDLLVGGKKLTGTWVEPHVGLSLSNLSLDFDLADKVLPPRAGRTHEALPPSGRMITANLILGRELSFSEFQDKFMQAIQETLHINLVLGTLTQDEENLIGQLMPKYLSKDWTLKGEF